MKAKIPSEFLEYQTYFHFDKKHNIVNIIGFNPECIMEVRYEIKNGKYKTITDDFQKITKQKYKKLLERFKNGDDIAPIIGEDIWAGNSTAHIQSLDTKISHKLYDDGEGRIHKYYYTTASRI